MKRILIVLSLMLVLLLLAQAGMTAGKEPYVIGAFLSVTGPAAPLGTPERDTLIMLEDKINKVGGINGHPLKIIIEDDASEPTNAVKAVKKLIEQDGVVAIIGGTSTGTTKAVIPLIEQAQKPFIACCAGSVGVTDPVTPWVFRTAPTDKVAAARILEYLVSIKLTKVAVIYDSNAFGTGGRDQLELQAPKVGVTLAVEEPFNTKDTDLTVQLTKAKNAGAQAIVCWGTNPAPAILTRNRQQLGIDIPLIQSHGVANKTYIQLCEGSAEGVVFPAGKILVPESLPAKDKQRKVLLGYAKEFTARFNREAETFGGHTWDGFHLVTGALKKVGPNPAKIRAHIEATKGFVGIGGIFNFSPADHDGLDKTCVVLIRIEGGQWKLFRR